MKPQPQTARVGGKGANHAPQPLQGLQASQTASMIPTLPPVRPQRLSAAAPSNSVHLIHETRTVVELDESHPAHSYFTAHLPHSHSDAHGNNTGAKRKASDKSRSTVASGVAAPGHLFTAKQKVQLIEMFPLNERIVVDAERYQQMVRDASTVHQPPPAAAMGQSGLPPLAQSFNSGGGGGGIPAGLASGPGFRTSSREQMMRVVRHLPDGSAMESMKNRLMEVNMSSDVLSHPVVEKALLDRSALLTAIFQEKLRRQFDLLTRRDAAAKHGAVLEADLQGIDFDTTKNVAGMMEQFQSEKPEVREIETQTLQFDPPPVMKQARTVEVQCDAPPVEKDKEQQDSLTAQKSLAFGGGPTPPSGSVSGANPNTALRKQQSKSNFTNTVKERELEEMNIKLKRRIADLESEVRVHRHSVSAASLSFAVPSQSDFAAQQPAPAPAPTVVSQTNNLTDGKEPSTSHMVAAPTSITSTTTTSTAQVQVNVPSPQSLELQLQLEELRTEYAQWKSKHEQLLTELEQDLHGARSEVDTKQEELLGLNSAHRQLLDAHQQLQQQLLQQSIAQKRGSAVESAVDSQQQSSINLSISSLPGARANPEVRFNEEPFAVRSASSDETDSLVGDATNGESGPTKRKKTLKGRTSQSPLMPKKASKSGTKESPASSGLLTAPMGGTIGRGKLKSISASPSAPNLSLAPPRSGNGQSPSVSPATRSLTLLDAAALLTQSGQLARPIATGARFFILVIGPDATSQGWWPVTQLVSHRSFSGTVLAFDGEIAVVTFDLVLDALEFALKLLNPVVTSKSIGLCLEMFSPSQTVSVGSSWVTYHPKYLKALRAMATYVGRGELIVTAKAFQKFLQGAVVKDLLTVHRCELTLHSSIGEHEDLYSIHKEGAVVDVLASLAPDAATGLLIPVVSGSMTETLPPIVAPTSLTDVGVDRKSQRKLPKKSGLQPNGPSGTSLNPYKVSGLVSGMSSGSSTPSTNPLSGVPKGDSRESLMTPDHALLLHSDDGPLSLTPHRAASSRGRMSPQPGRGVIPIQTMLPFDWEHASMFNVVPAPVLLSYVWTANPSSTVFRLGQQGSPGTASKGKKDKSGSPARKPGSSGGKSKEKTTSDPGSPAGPSISAAADDDLERSVFGLATSAEKDNEGGDGVAATQRVLIIGWGAGEPVEEKEAVTRSNQETVEVGVARKDPTITSLFSAPDQPAAQKSRSRRFAFHKACQATIELVETAMGTSDDVQFVPKTTQTRIICNRQIAIGTDAGDAVVNYTDEDFRLLETIAELGEVGPGEGIETGDEESSAATLAQLNQTPEPGPKGTHQRVLGAGQATQPHLPPGAKVAQGFRAPKVILDRQAMISELSCSVCREVLHQTHVLPLCGHSYCGDCVHNPPIVIKRRIDVGGNSGLGRRESTATALHFDVEYRCNVCQQVSLDAPVPFPPIDTAILALRSRGFFVKADA